MTCQRPAPNGKINREAKMRPASIARVLKARDATLLLTTMRTGWADNSSSQAATGVFLNPCCSNGNRVDNSR